MKQEKQILLALEGLNDKYIEKARPRTSKKITVKILTTVASFVLIIGAVIAIVLSGAQGGGVLGDENNDKNQSGDSDSGVSSTQKPFGDENSDYSELIATIDRYKNQVFEKNPFVGSNDTDDSLDDGIDAPSVDVTSSNPGFNGEYIENTDNQAAGVIEGDLMKMTDKYIFRIAYEGTDTQYDSNRAYVIKVFSVDKENSTLITEYKMPDFGGKILALGWEMYLSKDANLITLIVNYRDADNNQRIGVSSLNVSDVRNIQEVARFSVDGSSFSSRMVDGRLLLFANKYCYKSKLNTYDFRTLVPSVIIGEKTYYINPNRFVIPKEFDDPSGVDYTTILMVEENGLAIIDAIVVLEYNSEEYVSDNNIFLTRRYTEMVYTDDEMTEALLKTATFEDMSDIVVIGYSDKGFNLKDNITVKGHTNDQYSLDEQDGELRVVTTTRKGGCYKVADYWLYDREIKNASLYIIDLSDNSIVTSVENFAPDGEEAVSVRFEGDRLYVCTAIIATFSDPVYFFDLSDSSNITYTDTGFIEGFSTSLVDLGEGYLLGIGKENSQYSKIEVYKRENGSVVSVNKMLLDGSYANEYKAHLINRDHNLFGFAVSNLYDSETNTCENVYLIVQLRDGKLELIERIPVSGLGAAIVRAALVDGYVYITTYLSFVVEKVDL